MSASGCVSRWAASAGFELADLVVQLGDDADGGAAGGRERRGDRRGCGQLFGAQGDPDLADAGGDIALPSDTAVLVIDMLNATGTTTPNCSPQTAPTLSIRLRGSSGWHATTRTWT